MVYQSLECSSVDLLASLISSRLIGVCLNGYRRIQPNIFRAHAHAFTANAYALDSFYLAVSRETNLCRGGGTLHYLFTLCDHVQYNPIRYYIWCKIRRSWLLSITSSYVLCVRASSLEYQTRKERQRSERERKPGLVDRNNQDYGASHRRSLSTRRNDPRLNYPPSGGVLTSAIASVESSKGGRERERERDWPLIIYPRDEVENSGRTRSRILPGRRKQPSSRAVARRTAALS